MDTTAYNPYDTINNYIRQCQPSSVRNLLKQNLLKGNIIKGALQHLLPQS